jgi:cytochrome P450
MDFTLKQIREHQATPDTRRPDFLTHFLEAREKNPTLITEDLVNDYANTNVAGGSDTTAIILRTIFFQLSTQKHIGDRLLSEIKGTLKSRNLGTDVNTPITWAEGQGMPYLQALIKESLRWHPATAQIIPRIVPRGGVEMCGYYLPEGTQVGCNAWTVHRDKELYGQDADIFRPERWLEASDEHARKMGVSLFTFGAGKRACVGKNIALLEMSKFVPEAFRRFEIEVINPADYKISSTWLAVQKGFNVNLELRPQEPLLA